MAGTRGAYHRELDTLSTSQANAGSEAMSSLICVIGVSSWFTSFITRMATWEKGHRLK